MQPYHFEKQQMVAVLDFQGSRHIKAHFDQYLTISILRWHISSISLLPCSDKSKITPFLEKITKMRDESQTPAEAMAMDNVYYAKLNPLAMLTVIDLSNSYKTLMKKLSSFTLLILIR